jgi:microcystin-dependent protein
MTASGTSVYPGLYKARCTANNGRTLTVYIPQVFGTEPITMTDLTGESPVAGSFGYVAFEGGDAAYPVWVSSNSNNTTINNTEEPAYTATRDATREPIGHTDLTQSVMSFDNATRTLTIAPATGNDYFEVWCIGKPYRKTTPESITLPDESDLYYILFSSEGVLSYKTSYFDWDSDTPTAYVYWNSDTNKAEFFADERHGIVLDWQTHEYLHRTRGAAIANGFSVSNYVLGGNGSLDTHAQLDIANGTFFDEDLQVDISHSNSPTANTWQQDLQGPARIPVMYRSGAHWIMDSPTDFPMKQGTTTIKYNTVVGSTWSTTHVANNSYVPMFIVATNNLNYPVLSIMGQYIDSNLGKVQDYDWSDMELGDFPSVEFRPLYKVIVKALTSASNTVKASIIEIDDIRINQINPLGVAQAVSSSPTGALTAFAGSSAPTGWLLCYGQAVSRATYAALFSVVGTTYGSGDGSTTFNIPDMRGRVPVALDNMGGTDADRLTVANTLGDTGGKEKHLLLVAEMPSHSHLAGLLATTSAGSHVHGLNTLATVSNGTHKHTSVSYDGIYGIDNATVAAGGSYQGLYVNGSPNNRIQTNDAGSHSHSFTGSLQTTGDHTHPISGSTATEGGDGEHNNMQPYILTNYIIKT